MSILATLLIIVFGIGVVIFIISELLRSKKTTQTSKEIKNTSIKKEYPKKDQKDIAIEKYKKAQK